MLGLLLAIGLAQADAMMGVDWVPRAAASITESGTGVAENDGTLVPPIRPYAGLLHKRGAWLFSLSSAMLRTSVQTADDTRASTRAALRVSMDHRHYLATPEAGSPSAFVLGGVAGVFPFAAEQADGASNADSKALEKTADEDRARIGGAGVRLGGGAELMFESGLLLGFSAVMYWHRAQATEEQTRTVSTAIRPEGALSMGFVFPKKPGR